MTGKEVSNVQRLFRKRITDFISREDNNFTKTIDVYVKNENKCVITCFLSFCGLTMKNDKDKINKLRNKNIDLFKEYIKTVLCIEDVEIFYCSKYKRNKNLIQEIGIGLNVDKEMMAAYVMLSAIER